MLAAHTWEELNWLMSFPTENRRVSGVISHAGRRLRAVTATPSETHHPGRAAARSCPVASGRPAPLV